jgi:PRTRC genetic system protein A
MELQLVHHLVVNADGSIPETPNSLYAYILAGNGVFVYARRPGLEALIPVSTCKIAGLPELTPQVHIARCVPATLLEDALRFCKQVFPNEALFWFNRSDEWSINLPDQQTTNASAMPCDRHDKAGTSALIDLHSHGRFSPFFSLTDDQDEVGFRIYAVIGNVEKVPRISVRVGVYSHYFKVPASTVFELPDGILDILEQEDIEYETE